MNMNIIIRPEKLIPRKFGIKKVKEKLNRIIDRDTNNDNSNKENLYTELKVKKINIENIEHIKKYEASFLFGSLDLTSDMSLANLPNI